VILSRPVYEREFAEMLVSQFKYHPENAANEATSAIDEFLESEGVDWGNDAFYWDRDAAREHAFLWIDDGRREKHFTQ